MASHHSLDFLADFSNQNTADSNSQGVCPVGSSIMQLWLGAALIVVWIVAFQIAVAKMDLAQEAKRRWQHAITGQILVQVSYALPRNVCIVLLALGAAGIAYLQRFQTDLYTQLFGGLLRPHERQSLPGAFWFLVGTAWVASTVPMSEARYGVLCLAYADPMASWIGQRCGGACKIHDSASVAGCLACFLAAFVVGVCFFCQPSESSDSLAFSGRTIQKIGMGALVCTLTEAIPFANDNLLIPMTTALAVTWFEYSG